ncbi:thiamine pyrophosphate-binding protein [Paracoccus laeviglucosivorans]|uniref:Acetolactate synthase large subunit n=1 Tax=Paracoccus laeviglucosivorans TaxID=1197861 RepID=A0A521FNF2_9RHOB|nr:thiamine pyrophosphate-binding protein [Paracoccus laeviglucosivorans]SMO97728.1 Acetolactate synthase large subunit [Paracoccus laeviglucosivorans]
MQHDNPNPMIHQILARSLADLGVTDLFGLVGDANLFMVKSYVDGGLGRYVALTHEANAVLAAIGYAQVTGRTGVASITHGPALTNVVTALVEGVRACVPMVVMCGDTAPGDLQHLQDIDQREVVASTGAGFVELRGPHTLVVDLERAFRLAAHQRRPIVFNMRVDLQWQAAAAQPRAALPPELPRASAASDGLAEAAGMLASARRPLILAGRGAMDARDAIVALAQRIQAPLATTLKAQGLFTGEAFNLGICGGLSHPAATEAIMKSDCVIAFGASLSKHTTENGAYLRGKRIVQILPDIRENPRMDRPDLQLIGDPALTAQAMIDLLDMAEIPGSGATDDDLRAALQAEAQEFATLPSPRPTAAGTVDMVPALRALHQALPADRVLVADLGRFVTTAWRNLPVSDPRALVYTSHFGGIGCGLGQFVGAAVAAGARKTVLVAGDGGFLLSGLSELAGLTRLGADCAIIICNDGSYGAEHVQLTGRGMDVAISMIAPPDFAAVATAMGLRAQKVTDSDSLAQACALLSGPGPVLIDLRLDPDKIEM